MHNVPAAVAEAKRSRSNSSTCGDGTPAACLKNTCSRRRVKDLLIRQPCRQGVHAGRGTAIQGPVSAQMVVVSELLPPFATRRDRS